MVIGQERWVSLARRGVLIDRNLLPTDGTTVRGRLPQAVTRARLRRKTGSDKGRIAKSRGVLGYSWLLAPALLGDSLKQFIPSTR